MASLLAGAAVSGGEQAISLGPRASEFLRTCVEANAPLFITAWVTAGAAVLVTLVVTWRHASEISAAPISLQRLYYSRALWFPRALGITSLVSLFCPRAHSLCAMVQMQFEAVAMATFGTILFLLVAHESNEYFQGSDMASQPIALKITLALQGQGKKKHFGVPPFGCCFRPMITPHHLTARHLILVRNMFRQYAFVVVIIGIVVAWSALAMPYPVFKTESKILHILEKVSGLCAIYGLMIMYIATHDLLHRWRTTAKFVSIKLVVLLCAFQEVLVGLLVHRLPPSSDECLTTEGEGEAQHSAHREAFWSMHLLALESAGVALLVRRAFPAEEIQDFQEEHALQLVEMELEKLWSRSKALEDDSSSESDAREESDEDGQGDRVEQAA